MLNKQIKQIKRIKKKIILFGDGQDKLKAQLQKKKFQQTLR